MGSGTIWRCGLNGEGVTFLEETYHCGGRALRSYIYIYVQASPSVEFSIFQAAFGSGCRDLSSSSTMSAQDVRDARAVGYLPREASPRE